MTFSREQQIDARLAFIRGEVLEGRMDAGDARAEARTLGAERAALAGPGVGDVGDAGGDPGAPPPGADPYPATAPEAFALAGERLALAFAAACRAFRHEYARLDS